MSSIGSFTSMVRGSPAPQQATDQRTALGQVARAPASNDDSLFVVTPGLSLAFPFEVVADRWEHGSTLPPVGANCLVVLDDAGDAWVPLWEGYTAVAATSTADVGDIKMTAAPAAPPGWLLCNGLAVSRTTYPDLFALVGVTYGAGDGHSTFNLPNMTGRMPIGAGTGYAPGATGGEATHTLTKAEMPVHNHAGFTGTGTTATSSTGGGTTGLVSNDHTHTYSGTSNTENQSFNFNFSGTTAGPAWAGTQGLNVWAGGGGANFVAITYAATLVGGDARKYDDYNHSHTFSGTTGTQNQNHNHNYSGTTSGISANHSHSVPALSIPGLNVPALSIANDGSGGSHNNLPPYLAVNYVIKY